MALEQMFNLLVDTLKKREHKKVYDTYLVGYYGMQNSGDDALLLASIIGAKNYLKSESLLVSASNKIEFSGHEFEINPIRTKQLFKGQNRLTHYRGAMKSKRVIFGGGSVFHSSQDIQIKRQMMELTDPKACMALGVGLGPFNDKQAEKECQAFLNECGFVGVRDKKSFEIAQKLAPKANVALTFDLAPMLALAEENQAYTHVDEGILINVCPVPTDALGNTDETEQSVLLDKMSRVIEQLWQESKQPISLMSLNGHEQFGDNAVCQALVEKFADKMPIKFIPYQADPFAMMSIIRRHKVFVSMRLHGLVFGYLTGTPVVALNYHNKGQEWCEQVGMPMQQRFDAKSFNSKSLLETVTQGLKFGFSEPVLALNDAIAKSVLNWSKRYV